MSFPIICYGCKKTSSIDDLLTISTCADCGSDDLDLNDREASVEKEAINNYFRCNSCGAYGVSHNSDEEYCGQCGSSDLSRSDAHPDAIPAKSTQGSKQAHVALVEEKLKEIAAGVIATNPSIHPEAALEIAHETLRRYPKVAGLDEVHKGKATP